MIVTTKEEELQQQPTTHYEKNVKPVYHHIMRYSNIWFDSCSTAKGYFMNYFMGLHARVQSWTAISANLSVLAAFQCIAQPDTTFAGLHVSDIIQACHQARQIRVSLASSF